MQGDRRHCFIQLKDLMNCQRILIGAGLLLGLFAGPAHAQPGGLLMIQVSRWENTSLPLQMVRNETIKSHLKLTEQDLEQINDEVKKTHQKIDRIFKENLSTHSKEELAKIREKCRSEVQRFPFQMLARMEKTKSKQLEQLCRRYLMQQDFGSVPNFLVKATEKKYKVVSGLQLSSQQIVALQETTAAKEQDWMKILKPEQQEWVQNLLGDPYDFKGLRFRL